VWAPGAAAQERASTGIADNTPDDLRARIDRAVDSGNLETALYAYRSLYHATGEEDAARLSGIAALTARDELGSAGWVGVSAAELLARRGDPDGLRRLRVMVTDQDVQPTLRRGAIEVLGDLGDRESIPVLQSVVYDEERSLDERFAATDALLAMDDLHGVAFLLRMLEGDRLALRLRAALLLGDHEIATTKPLRAAAAPDQAPELRLEALRALARTGDAEARRTLVEILGESTEAVLPELPGAETPDGERVVYEDLSEMSQRLRAGEILLEVGDPRGVDLFAAWAEVPDPPFNTARLVGFIEEVDPSRARKLYRKLLAPDRSDLVRVEAAGALAAAGETEGVLETLEAMYGASKAFGDPVRLRAIDIAGAAASSLPGAADLLYRAMTEDHEDLHRLRAAVGLVGMRDPRGVKVLRDYLEGLDRMEALIAAKALLAYGDAAGPPRAG
jgi:HEAT repeat protein